MWASLAGHRMTSLLVTPSPEAPQEQFRQLLRDDACLMTIWLLSRVYEAPTHPGSPEASKVAIKHVDAHWPTCPVAVRQTAVDHPHPIKKRFYGEVMRRFIIAFARRSGEYRSEETAEGWLCYWKVDPLLGTPFSSTEAFKPRRQDITGHYIYDVLGQEMFDNPLPLLQWTDVTLTADVQDYSGTLQWRSLFSEERYRLGVRWQGEVKWIAPGWTLHDRYGGVIRKHLAHQAIQRRQALSFMPDQPNLMDEVMALRQIALEYRPKRSWFMGFLDRTLPNRLKDQWDHEQVDLLAHAARRESPGSEVTDLPQDAAPKKQVEHWPQTLEELHHRIDAPWRWKRLWADLDEVERQILQLKSEDLPDEEIARRLGYARESITRIRADIRQKAASVASAKRIRGRRRKSILKATQ